MTKLTDMAGRKINRLKVLSRDLSRVGAYWLCVCDCGTTVSVSGPELRKGQKSCGCVKREVVHGGSRKGARMPEYAALKDAVQRCENPKHREYRNYGARGIHVCDEWRNDFSAFLAEVGPKPGPDFSLDRIDVSEGYVPGNCRWADKSVQSHNKHPTSNTGLLGVHRTASGSFQWSVKRKGVRLHGRCLTLVDAEAARAEAQKKLYPDSR